VVDRLIAVAGIAAISLAAILYHQSGASPATGAFFRAVYALPVLFWLARSHQVSGRMHALAFGGGMLFGIDIVLWHEAIGRIGTGLATVLANTQVVWVGLGAWVLLRERPPGRFFLALPVMLGGIALLAGLGDADAFGSDPIGGSLFGLTGALAYAGYLLIHRRVCRGERRPAAQLRDATLGMAFGALRVIWRLLAGGRTAARVHLPARWHAQVRLRDWPRHQQELGAGNALSGARRAVLP
jgi:drug/metabolite transporter (DMT)-like permease